jgi:hypothetical protein
MYRMVVVVQGLEQELELVALVVEEEVVVEQVLLV